jgi:HAD superfamily hydrolase (TIGR01459 family)
MSFWDALDPKFRVILCDVWGVIHDGVSLYPGAAARLDEWRGEGRTVILVTNAPRTEAAVAAQLGRIGLPPDCWNAIATSGEAGIEALLELHRPVGFIGTPEDRAILEGRGVRIAAGEDFSDLAVTGMDLERPLAAEYRELDRFAARGVRLHCLNPDRVVIRGGVAEACAGAIADIYEDLSGEVIWYGKPHRPIYEYALELAGDPPLASVLAVGDSLRTDILGAARIGIDAVFVSGGIHAGEPIPPGFAAEHGLGDWRPLAVVEGLS